MENFAFVLSAAFRKRACATALFACGFAGRGQLCQRGRAGGVRLLFLIFSGLNPARKRNPVAHCKIPYDTQPGKNPNSIVLSGYICKPPVYRTTPFNRERHDFAVDVDLVVFFRTVIHICLQKLFFPVKIRLTPIYAANNKVFSLPASA